MQKAGVQREGFKRGGVPPGPAASGLDYPISTAQRNTLNCGMRISDCGFKNKKQQSAFFSIRNPNSAFRNSSESLDDHGDALTAADAGRGETVTTIATAKLKEHGQHKARA